jgi:hypothetical protein
MNAKQMLKAAGCSDTVAGRKKFHDMYPTPKHFFAKHGEELSGAPHNGQPTAAEFFSWGQPVIGPQGFYGDGGSNKMSLSNDEVVKMATELFKSAYSSTNMEDYNKLSATDKARVQSIYNTASKYSGDSKGAFPFTPGSNAFYKSDLKDASDSAEYLSGYQRGKPLNREEAIGNAMFLRDLKYDETLPAYMSGEFQRNDDYKKSGQGWTPKKTGGNVEYQRALALVTKAMGGQAGVEMRSTNDYLQNENEYLTDYLNQGQQQFMRNGGNLTKFAPGGQGSSDSSSDNNGRGGPGSSNGPEKGESYEQWSNRNGIVGGGVNGGNYANNVWTGTGWEKGYENKTENRYGTGKNYSDGYDPRNDPRYNQNPNYYRQSPGMPSYGYNPTPYMGIWGALGSTAGRFGPKIKIKNKMYGDINYGSQQSGTQDSQGSSMAPRNIDEASSQGSSQKQAPKNNGAPEGYTPYEEVIKRGFWNRVAPNKFAPKHTRVGYERTGQGNNNPGFQTQNNMGSGSGGSGSKSPYQQNTQMSPYEVYASGNGAAPKNAYPMQGANGGRYMGPDINESDTNLPVMNINRKSPFGAGFPAMYGPQEVTSDDYSAQSDYSPFTVFGNQPMGPSKADGSYRRGGMVPKFVDGGNGFYTPDYRDQTDIYGGMGFDWSNLNPYNIMGAAQDGTDFLENAQRTRLVNQQRERLQNPLNTNPDLEEQGYIAMDSNISDGVDKKGVSNRYQGQANMDRQIAGSRMQGGGAVQVGDVVEDWSDDELAQFLANGGQVEFIDEE